MLLALSMFAWRGQLPLSNVPSNCTIMESNRYPMWAGWAADLAQTTVMPSSSSFYSRITSHIDVAFLFNARRSTWTDDIAVCVHCPTPLYLLAPHQGWICLLAPNPKTQTRPRSPPQRMTPLGYALLSPLRCQSTWSRNSPTRVTFVPYWVYLLAPHNPV